MEMDQNKAMKKTSVFTSPWSSGADGAICLWTVGGS